jgi:CRISPR-associated Csx3 family protein
MSLKIVVAGPPHSGKSVFLGGLCECLPREGRYLFRACPDGEGTWTWKSAQAAKYRRKGTFTRQQVQWYVDKLANIQMADVVLVDIGGRTTDENRRILVEGKVDAAVILAGDLDAMPEWESFLQDCEVPVLARLHSDYNGKEDVISGPIMRVHHLERGEDVSSRPAIGAVAAQILDMVQGKEAEMPKGMITISGLVEELGKEAVERTLPNGRVVQQVCWSGEDLSAVARLLHNHSAEMSEHVQIDGAAPAWLVAAIAHECHPRSISVNSPDGYVPIGVRRPEGKGSGDNLSFAVEEKEGYHLVTCQMEDPSLPLSPDGLADVVPPELPMGAVVVLSGRMPNWLAVSLAMAYHGTAKAVALFQPGTGATVAWTHSKKVGLGSIIQVD